MTKLTKVLDGIKVAFVDLDGTIYCGKELVPDADLLVNRLQEKNIRVVYLSNNTFNSKEEIVERLQALKIEAKESDIHTALYAAIGHIASNGFRSAYCIGSNFMKEELIKQGVNVLSDDSNEQPDCVLSGIDFEINIKKLGRAIDAIMDGASYFACNRDRRLSLEGGKFYPGAGSFTKLIENATQKEATAVFGKPNTKILDAFLSLYKKEEMLIIGDNEETDIALGKALNLKSIFLGTAPSEATISVSTWSELFALS